MFGPWSPFLCAFDKLLKVAAACLHFYTRHMCMENLKVICMSYDLELKSPYVCKHGYCEMLTLM